MQAGVSPYMTNKLTTGLKWRMYRLGPGTNANTSELLSVSDSKGIVCLKGGRHEKGDRRALLNGS
jgi:hypothetical protein